MNNWQKPLLVAIGVLIVGYLAIIYLSANTSPWDSSYDIGIIPSGAVLGYSCYALDGVEVQMRDGEPVLLIADTGKVCHFERGTKGLFNVSEMTNVNDKTGNCLGSCEYMGDLNWAFEIGKVEEGCDERLNRAGSKVAGFDNRVFNCGEKIGV